MAFRRHIWENWTSISEVEADMRKKLDDPRGRFEGVGDSNAVMTQFVVVPFLYENAEGEMTRAIVIADYCPFTGKKLFEDE